MKTILGLLFISSIIFFGCSNDSGNPTGGGFGTGGTGGGGGGTGNVTVPVTLVQDNNQAYYFEFTPSATVYMTQIIANCAAAGINNSQVTVNLSCGPNDPVDVPLQGINLQVGQQWTFQISGNIGNAQGQAFNVTSNFTIQ